MSILRVLRASALVLALAWLAAPPAHAHDWYGNGTCQYGWRDGRGFPWNGRNGCWNDVMCRDGNPNTWDRCVSGYGHDEDYGYCKHGWSHGAGWWHRQGNWWWGHGRCSSDYECRDGNPNTWDRCDQQ
jgi:hypothetical protein